MGGIINDNVDIETSFFLQSTPLYARNCLSEPSFLRQELEGLLEDPEVAALEVVEREKAYVDAYGAAVRRMSADALGRGLKALNQTDVGGALQVCHLFFFLLAFLLLIQFSRGVRLL